jgi:hypothetical protein
MTRGWRNPFGANGSNLQASPDRRELAPGGRPPSGIVWELAWRLLRPATNLCLDRGSAGYKTYAMIDAYSEGREISDD